MHRPSAAGVERGFSDAGNVMAWQKLALHVAQQRVDALSELLQTVGAISVTLEDAANELLIETLWHEAPLWRRVTVSALFPESTDVGAVLNAVTTAGIDLLAAPAIEAIADQAWERVWMERYHPIKVGPRLWVCPSWCEPTEPDAVNVILDPGLAFGTGTHATTALCLEWLAEQALSGRGVIDYGCGSGILAIAALKLGAAWAWAIDVDPQALQVARENAARNGVAERLTVGEPSQLPVDVKADFVLANILAAALIELAPILTKLTRTGGRVALSGIMAHQADEVGGAYRQAFELANRHRDDWVLLTGTKR
jgi:ribosomal protein L11 methyltransferase